MRRDLVAFALASSALFGIACADDADPRDTAQSGTAPSHNGSTTETQAPGASTASQPTSPDQGWLELCAADRPPRSAQ